MNSYKMKQNKMMFDLFYRCSFPRPAKWYTTLSFNFCSLWQYRSHHGLSRTTFGWMMVILGRNKKIFIMKLLIKCCVALKVKHILTVLFERRKADSTNRCRNKLWEVPDKFYYTELDNQTKITYLCVCLTLVI